MSSSSEITTVTIPEPVANTLDYDLFDPALYINRELSLLEFNRRVLEEAQDSRHPILERAKFLAIYSSNMDEFFMVRVAGLMQQVNANVSAVPADGLTPSEQLAAIRKKIRADMKVVDACYHDIQRQLGEAGIHLLHYDELTRPQQHEANEYFKKEIFPVLTPFAVDPGRPFPHISSRSLNLAVVVHDPHSDEHALPFARIKVPNVLPRLVPVKRARDLPKSHRFVWLEELVANNLHELFPGYDIVEKHLFRITRNADFAIEGNEAGDLLETITHKVRRRRFGLVVRLTVTPQISERVFQFLCENLQVGTENTYERTTPLGLNGLMDLMDLDRPDLKFPQFFPTVPPRLQKADQGDEIFNVIRTGDVLLHHPYDSFDPVVDFLRAAASDPHVLAIKQTLYRAGKNSPVVDALLEAIENGKQVTAMVEIKARFDEESNISWARKLERVGVHVVYGFMGLKTHSKISLVVRREAEGIRRYVHLSTGNYNAVTAKLYTDLGFFTCNPDFGADASDLFNALTGYSQKDNYLKFLVAPQSLRRKFADLINREIYWAEQGQPAKLIFRMNSLIDPELIRQLYQASQAGVKIELLVRGICGLRPGIPNLSHNIRVTSVVGRFLEHTRIYYFHNGGHPRIYLGSADLMTRNLDRRIETLFPVEDPALKHELIDILEVAMADNINARRMLTDGSYVRLSPGTHEPVRDSQAEFMRRATTR